MMKLPKKNWPPLIMSDKTRIFSLFEEFSEEQKNELSHDRHLNSDALLIDGMNTLSCESGQCTQPRMITVNTLVDLLDF